MKCLHLMSRSLNCIYKSNCTSIICWKDYPLSMECFCSFVKDLFIMFLNTLLWSINLCIYSFNNITFSYVYCCLEIRMQECSKFILIIKYCVTITGILLFHINFRINVCPQNSFLWFWLALCLLYKAGKNDNIVSCNSLTWIFAHLYRTLISFISS